MKIEARGALTSPIQAERSAVVKRKPRPALGTDRGSDMGIFEGAGSLPSSPIQAECSAGVNGPPASHNLNRKPLWTGQRPGCLLARETAPPSPNPTKAVLGPRRANGPQTVALGVLFDGHVSSVDEFNKKGGRSRPKCPF